MRAYLNNNGVKAEYEFIREFYGKIASPSEFRTLKGESEKWLVRVSHNPYKLTMTVYFAKRGDTRYQIHTRTAKNPVTVCDTLASLGITSMDMLTMDNPTY